MRKETSILLPAGRIDFFLKDQATIEAARSLASDWRFARVVVRVQEGTVEDAIKIYERGSSPDMVLIETDTTGDGFIDRLADLSGHCEQGTSAVVIGPVNDVNLYRSLTSMGVSDYLVRPVPAETLADVIATTLISKLGTAGSRLLAVIGAKGGVGTSSLAQIMAWEASQNLEQKTIVMDAAGAWSTAPVSMGFEPSSSASEAVRAASAKDMDSFRRMLFYPSDKLSVLATGAEPMLEPSIQPQGFEEIINTAMASYPLVIADLSGASISVRKTVLTRAHEIVIVSTPTLSSLRCARTLMQEIEKLTGGHEQGMDLVINMSGIASGREVSKSDITAAMDIAPSLTIPFDPKLFIGAESEGKKVIDEKFGQDIAAGFQPILQKAGVKNATGSDKSENADSAVSGLLKKIGVVKG